MTVISDHAMLEVLRAVDPAYRPPQPARLPFAYFPGPIPEGAELPTMDDGDDFGLHTVMDVHGVSLEKITSATTVGTFGAELARHIDMKPYGEPLVARFALHVPKAAGYSAAQLIETSLISGHFSERRARAYVDVFSCQAYDPRAVVDYTMEYFKGERLSQVLVIVRT